MNSFHTEAAAPCRGSWELWKHSLRPTHEFAAGLSYFFVVGQCVGHFSLSKVRPPLPPNLHLRSGSLLAAMSGGDFNPALPTGTARPAVALPAPASASKTGLFLNAPTVATSGPAAIHMRAAPPRAALDVGSLLAKAAECASASASVTRSTVSFLAAKPSSSSFGSGEGGPASGVVVGPTSAAALGGADAPAPGSMSAPTTPRRGTSGGLDALTSPTAKAGYVPPELGSPARRRLTASASTVRYGGGPSGDPSSPRRLADALVDPGTYTGGSGPERTFEILNAAITAYGGRRSPRGRSAHPKLDKCSVRRSTQ